MPSSERGVLVGDRTVRRMARATLGFEARVPRDQRGRIPAASGLGLMRAVVTVAIPTGSDASPSSSGRVRLRRKDGGGAWVAGDVVPVWNDNTLPSPIPVNRVVKVAPIAGEMWLISGSCS